MTNKRPLERIPVRWRNKCGKMYTKKKKVQRYKRNAYEWTQKSKQGYVLRQPITFETSMDDHDDDHVFT